MKKLNKYELEKIIRVNVNKLDSLDPKTDPTFCKADSCFDEIKKAKELLRKFITKK